MPSMLKSFFICCLLIFIITCGLFAQGNPSKRNRHSKSTAVLIPAWETMETAWDYPKNPLKDSLPGNNHVVEQIRSGFEIFIDTPNKASRFSGNKLSCNNCHLNAGQKDKAMAIVGIAGAFPEYNKRAGRLISLEDRIVECFMRSSNASGKIDSTSINIIRNGENDILPTAHSKEVLALSAYISWISEGFPVGKKIAWRGQNVIRAEKLIPVEKLDVKIGEHLYMEKCISCHGEDGQGVEIGDRRAGPLWGPDSWNDGAGAARVYTLAGIIRYMMPYLDPGSLSEEEAQHIAAFITSKPRPRYPFKEQDYPTDKVPIDAVYYERRGK